jgi:hypothetical protein
MRSYSIRHASLIEIEHALTVELDRTMPVQHCAVLGAELHIPDWNLRFVHTLIARLGLISSPLR